MLIGAPLGYNTFSINIYEEYLYIEYYHIEIKNNNWRWDPKFY